MAEYAALFNMTVEEYEARVQEVTARYLKERLEASIPRWLALIQRSLSERLVPGASAVVRTSIRYEAFGDEFCEMDAVTLRKTINANTSRTGWTALFGLGMLVVDWKNVREKDN